MKSELQGNEGRLEEPARRGASQLVPFPNEKQMGGAHCRRGKNNNASRKLVGKSNGKRRLGRPRRKWEDNIKRGIRYDEVV
jgi:hypothetical protein